MALPQVLMYGAAPPGEFQSVTCGPFGDEDIPYVSVPTIDNVTEYTVTGWARIEFPIDFHVAFSEVRGSGIATREINVGVSPDGENPLAHVFFTFGTGSFTAAGPDAERWFFFALTKRSNGVWEGSWCYLEETEFDGVNKRCGNESSFGSTPPDVAAIGVEKEADNNTFYSIFGQVCQIRRWKAVLSDVELLAEKDSSTAVRTLNLYSSNPLRGVADISDESGNGRLAEPIGNVLSSEEGPGN